MFKLLLAVAILICGSQGLEDARIIGGSDAQLGEFPYIVSIRTDKVHKCGGSIITKDWILTAAHCVLMVDKDPSILVVHYGILYLSDKTEGIPVSKVIKHEKYINGGGYKNDIALLKLSSPITMTEKVQSIELPEVNESPKAKTAILAGWGSRVYQMPNSNRLQKVTLDVIADDVCLENEILYSSKIQMCAGKLEGGKGQCSGDSGGPLVANGKQYGVVSWAHKPCASPGHAGIFAKVSAYMPWIRDKINKN